MGDATAAFLRRAVHTRWLLSDSMRPMASPRIAVRVPDDLYTRLVAAARSDNRTVSNYVQNLLAKALPDTGEQESLFDQGAA